MAGRPAVQGFPDMGNAAWDAAGKPGYAPGSKRLGVAGFAQDGTAFGYRDEARAYDRWRGGGQAQPIQQPSQGTPYGQYQNQWREKPSAPGSAPATGGNAAANDSRWGAGKWAYGMAPAAGQRGRRSGGRPAYGLYLAGTSPEYMAANPDSGPYAGQTISLPGATFGAQGFGGYSQAGNVANNPYGKPAPFTSTMQDGYGNPTNPNQFYAQQQDMIGSLLGRLGAMPSGTYLGPGQPPPSWGAPPSFDMPQMWQQAGARLLATPGSRPTPPPLPPGQGWMY
jgi:hypothetical protein